MGKEYFCFMNLKAYIFRDSLFIKSRNHRFRIDIKKTAIRYSKK